MLVIAQNGMGYDLTQLKDIGVRNTLSGVYVLEARMKCDNSRVRLGIFKEKADAHKAMHGIHHGTAKNSTAVRIKKGSAGYAYIG